MFTSLRKNADFVTVKKTFENVPQLWYKIVRNGAINVPESILDDS